MGKTSANIKKCQIHKLQNIHKDDTHVWDLHLRNIQGMFPEFKKKPSYRPAAAVCVRVL